MRISKLIFTFSIICLTGNFIFSQHRTISDVAYVQLRNAGPILTGNEVTGYYLFYKTDRVKMNVFSYKVEILDQNLNKVASQSIEGSRYLTLLNGVYNNTSLMLKLYEAGKRELIFLQFDNQANQQSKTTRRAGRMEAAMLQKALQTDDGQDIDIFPISNTGFVDYRVVKNKSYGYVIDFYPTNGKGKKWSTGSDLKSKDLEFATHIYGDENIIVSSILTKPSMFSTSVEMKLLTIDAKTGEKMYEKKIADPDYELFALNGLESDQEGNFYMLGNYYPKGKNELNSKSLGIFEAKLDKEGNVIERHFTSWSDDVSQFVDVNKKGKIKDVGFVFFHDIIRNADGNLYAIGEQFKKVMLGIQTNIVTKDMMILELDKNYTLKNVNIIDKDETKIILPKGMGINGAQSLAYYVKSRGGFDYEFTCFNKDRSIFSIGYTDYEKVSGAPNETIYGAITYADSKPTNDKVKLATSRDDKKYFKVLPSKIGSIVIMEYFKKEKKLDLRMEKINY